MEMEIIDSDMVTREQYEEAQRIISQYNIESRERAKQTLTKALIEAGFMANDNFSIEEMSVHVKGDERDIVIRIKVF